MTPTAFVDWNDCRFDTRSSMTVGFRVWHKNLHKLFAIMPLRLSLGCSRFRTQYTEKMRVFQNDRTAEPRCCGRKAYWEKNPVWPERAEDQAETLSVSEKIQISFCQQSNSSSSVILKPENGGRISVYKTRERDVMTVFRYYYSILT